MVQPGGGCGCYPGSRGRPFSASLIAVHPAAWGAGTGGRGEADCRPGRSWDRALALRAVCPGAHPCLPLHLSYRRLINGGDEAHICGCCVDGEKVCYLPSGSPDAERVLALPGWMEHCTGSQEPWGLSPSPPRTFLPSGPQFPYPMVRWLRLEDL